MLGILTEEQINETLLNNNVGRIGYNDDNGVHIIPIIYLYDGKYIIGHSKDGSKIQAMKQRPDVCFEVDEIDKLPEWKSVMLWGKYEELTEKRERYYALDRLLRKINKLKTGLLLPVTHDQVADESLLIPDEVKSIVYRIRIEKITGRFEKNNW
jgi:uncharacterized protein